MSYEMVSRLITNLEKKPMLEDDSMLSPGITKKSSKEEVSMWLQEEGFILSRDKLKGITGKELYGMPKEDLRRMLGFAEAARLFSKLLKEKELLPAAEKTIKESDFERFMRIRREDVDSRIPNNPITTFNRPTVPPKPTRPMIREVFHDPDEPVRGRYAEKVKKTKEKSSEKRFSKRAENAKEVSRKKERSSKYRRESPESEVESEGEEKRRHKHKKDKKERKEREEGRGKKDRHKRSHKSKQSSESDTSSDSESDESVDAHPKSSRHKRRERDRKKNQEKEKKKEPEPTVSPSPAQPYLTDPLLPQISPYAPLSPVSPMLTPHLHPQYPPPFPDPYTNQLMMQQAQIVRAEQDKFAAEMRLRQLKSGFGAPGALSFPPPMPYHSF